MFTLNTILVKIPCFLRCTAYKLKIATYNVITLLRDEHIQELEELRETRLAWDVMGISEVRRREECFTTLQNSLSMANNGQARK